MFWIRFSLMVFTLIFVGIVAFNQFVPNFGLTFGRRLIVSIGTTTAYVGSCLLVAATNLIGFPIPFMWQIGALLVGVYTPMMFVFVFGVAPFAVNSPFRPHLRRYIVLLISYMSLGAVFPLYKLLYEHVPETYKAGALVALPMWRFAAKHFMMWTSRELEDFVPVIIALTVDFFSAMFVSVCISSSSSIYLSVLFIAVDVGQALLEFREVSNNSHTILNLLEGETFRTPSNLLMRIVAVTRAPSEFGIVSLKRTRLWACLPHPISLEQMDNLNALETSGLYGPKGLLSSRRKRQLRNKTEKLNSIVPASISELISQNSSMTLRSDSSSGIKAKELVDQGMDLLFHCEYLALVEYVECVIPLVFATDKIILKQLPNVNYYPGGVVKWGEAALANVIIFAMLEVGSLFLLHYFLQRKFNFSLLYQLAFALETSMNFVQSALFLEIVGLLQYELAHLGETGKRTVDNRKLMILLTFRS
ncbi:hypothetical protein PHMEG_0001449 [Phytophthora megakarya]|uniref:Transmembrane protein n=1 Tax=Phytophthora megakarya TaxID=4795 RepID=A0A225X0J9_9STRA|nr:hypothetical protein PHMEG_0001449 [Phytophthora megakarya]